MATSVSVYVDTANTNLTDTPSFVRTVATESTDATQSAVRLVKRVTADTTLANDNGGPSVLFQRGYGSTGSNDTGFAYLGATYEGVTDDHEVRIGVSTDNFSSNNDRLLTLSRKNANFNTPVNFKTYANLTAINAISGPQEGMVVYNSGTDTLYVYSGTQWNDVATIAQTAYTLPAATTSTLGGVIIPAVGTSGITNSTGTIGLATASTTQLGGVKVDGSTITINGSGVISTSTSSTNLNALTDVTIGTLAGNQQLIYNSATSQWVNSLYSTNLTSTNVFNYQASRATSSGDSTLLSGALNLNKYSSNATTGADHGGPALTLNSYGTNLSISTLAQFGAYNNSSGVQDAVIKTTSNNSTFNEIYVGSEVRTNINNGLLYVDKTNTEVGINTTTPDRTLHVAGTARITGDTLVGGTLGVTGQITGNLTGNVTGNVSGSSGSTTGNAATVTNGVYTTGSYANPSWITSLAYSKLTGTPTTITNIDDLADVTITSANKGNMLFYNGTAWVNSSKIEFDNGAYRPTFVANLGLSTADYRHALEVYKNTDGLPASGDGGGIALGTIKADGTKYTQLRIVGAYDASYPKLVLQSSTGTDNFATVSNNLATFTTEKLTLHSNVIASSTADAIILNGDDIQVQGTLQVNGNSIYSSTAEAIQLSGNTVSTVGEFTSGGRINTASEYGLAISPAGAGTTFATGASYGLRLGGTTGDLLVGNDVGIYGDTLKLNAGQTSDADAFITVERGANDASIKWNSGTDRWQTVIAGTTVNIPNQELDATSDPIFNSLEVDADIIVEKIRSRDAFNVTQDTIIFDGAKSEFQDNVSILGDLSVSGTFSQTTVTATDITATNLVVNGLNKVRRQVLPDTNNHTIVQSSGPFVQLPASLGAKNFNLGNGADGQVMYFYNPDTDAHQISVTTASWNGGSSGTIIFSADNSACTLVYASGKGWVCVGNNNATFT